MYEYLELKNKAKVYFIPLQDTKSLTTLVMYPVGSRFESSKMAGVSHYVEHLMFKGTKKRPNTLVLTREIDRLGAQYNAFTGKEYTGYYIKADAKYSEVSMDILSDMLFNSKFDEKEMEREKGPIIEEIRMYKDNPLMNIENIFEDLMFAGCPLGRDIAGSEDNVRSYKRPDVLKYRDTYYSPDNMTIVVAGSIDEKIKKEVVKYFGIGKNSGVKKREYLPACFGSVEKSKRIVIEKKETDQVQMMLGFQGFNHEDSRNYASSVMNTILGGSMSSRLFIQIRERR
ncbi:MAG: pitrilysin family protein, partial [Candidatus Magasanikbacteria bacterium]